MTEPPEKQPTTPPPPYYVMMPPPMDDDEISLVDLWRVLAEHKWLIFTITFLFTAGATTYALLATPIYRAEVLATPAQKPEQPGRLGALVSQFGGLANLAGVSLPGGGDIETAIATLKSRRLISGFIAERNLKPILFHKDWDSEQKRWIPEHPLVARIKNIFLPNAKRDPSEHLVPGEPTMWDAFERFREDILTVSLDTTTGLVTVQVDWKDPILAADWANILTDRLNNELRQQVIKESERAIQYLKEEVQQTSLADLRTVLYRIIEEHTKNITLAKVNEEYALKIIDPAVPSQKKAKPRRALIVSLGIALGLISGVLGAFLRRHILQNRLTPDKATTQIS